MYNVPGCLLGTSTLTHLIVTAAIDHLCLGSGASDILDLIIRATCTPGRDTLLIAPPTFELYRVCATLHEVRVKECAQELTAEGDFRLPIEEVR